jgi:hypothetical protein
MPDSPYHTVIPAVPPERDVYHDYTDCGPGSSIEPDHWRSGKDGRPRCEVCISMD